MEESAQEGCHHFQRWSSSGAWQSWLGRKKWQKHAKENADKRSSLHQSWQVKTQEVVQHWKFLHLQMYLYEDDEKAHGWSERWIKYNTDEMLSVIYPPLPTSDKRTIKIVTTPSVLIRKVEPVVCRIIWHSKKYSWKKIDQIFFLTLCQQPARMANSIDGFEHRSAKHRRKLPNKKSWVREEAQSGPVPTLFKILAAFRWNVL